MGEIKPRDEENIDPVKFYRVDESTHEESGEWDCSLGVIQSKCCCLPGGLIQVYYTAHWQCTPGGIGCSGGEARVTSVIGPYDTADLCVAANPECAP